MEQAPFRRCHGSLVKSSDALLRVGRAFQRWMKKVIYHICILYTHLYIICLSSSHFWMGEEYEIRLCRHIFRWGPRNCHLFLVVAGALTFISILSAPPSHTWQNAKMLSMFSCGMSNILRLKSTCCNFCKVGKIHDTSTLQVVYVTGGGFVSLHIPQKDGHGRRAPGIGTWRKQHFHTRQFISNYRGIWRGDPIGIWTWFSAQAQHGHQKESVGVSDMTKVFKHKVLWCFVMIWDYLKSKHRPQSP